MTVASPQRPVRAPQSPSRERVELILNHLDRLPALPGVVARLLAVTSSEESSARDVVTVIESDAVLTAGILRLVRRADLGVRPQGMTVVKAVTLLGMRMVRNAALSSQFFETLSPQSGDEAESKLRAGLWEHSLGVACAAELIGQLHGGDDLAGEAFVCGLLHDIGKIALGVCLPKSYAKAAEYAQRNHTCISTVECEVFGLDHTVAGKRLTARWGLSQAVQECVWLHHQNPDDLPSTIGHAKLVRIVHLADHLVRRLGIGFSGYAHVGSIDRLALSLGVRPDGIERIIRQLPEKMAPVREILGLEESPESSPPAAVDEGLQRRLTQANARLSEENQQLHSKSGYFEAVGRFASLVSEHDLVGDICAAAAETLADLFGANAVIVFVRRNDNRIVQAGVFDGAENGRRAAIVEVPDVAPMDSGEAVWRSLMQGQGPAGLRRLPLSLDELQAEALLAFDGLPARDLPSADQLEWRVLSRAITLALAWSSSRRDSEAMTQELLDLNRRCREAEQQLVRMRSISMVGEMAAGAAHELNNPLAVISGRAQMELDFAVEPERRRAMEIVVEQAKRASQIVLDLMNFAKPDPPQPQLLPVRQTLHAALQHWKKASGRQGAAVSMNDSDPLLCVYADAQQLRDILCAVLDNAIQACDSSGCPLEINSPSRASDEMVRIVVADNGPGMSPEVLEHAFDPFFSYRPAGRGRGMGLTLGYRLAEINGGRLWINSKPGEGTRVTIELPSRPPLA